MQKTTNLKLNKPDYSDVADIADINANMDKLDNEVHKNTTAISNINSNKADKIHNHNNGADLTNVNASKLGGKSASDFAACSVINNGDFNNVTNAGLYTIRSCANSPDGGNYYGLLVVKSDTGDYIEQMAFKENTYKVFVRYCYGVADESDSLDWYAWEEIGSKYAEKLRIFDVDGRTLKDTNGVNDVASITPKQVTENEARITGFDTNKYWFNFGIPNQTLKVPYADMAIRALSFGLQAIPADTGVVRNVEGISDAVMNDPLFPVGYITRTHTSPYSHINGREYHIMYFPSTRAYGTQIAIIEQAFHGKVNSSSGWNLIVYMRSGHERINISASETTTYRNRGYTVTKDPSDDSKYIAADWSE